MADADLLWVLDELTEILQPVANTGASRETLHAAVKKALEAVDDAYAEIEGEEEDEEETGDEEEQEEDEGEVEPDEEEAHHKA